MIQLEWLEIARCSLQPLPPNNHPQSTPTCPCCQLIPPDTLAGKLRAARCQPQMRDRRGWARSAKAKAKSPSWIPSVQEGQHELMPMSYRQRKAWRSQETMHLQGSQVNLRKQTYGSPPAHSYSPRLFKTLKSWHQEEGLLRASYIRISSLFNTKN